MSTFLLFLSLPLKAKGKMQSGAASPPSGITYLLVWIVVSCSVILLNKAILSAWDFGYPLFLTCWHMLFATIMTQVLARTSNWLPGVQEEKMTRKVYQSRVLPISLCFAFSLMLGNNAYLYLSVSYIQMLKSFTPVAVLILSFFGGLEKPSALQLSIVSVISAGAAFATVGELRFSMIGFAFQISGIFVEALRLVLSDQFLKSLKLDSLSVLYYIAPPSCIFLFLGFMFLEAQDFPWARLSDPFLGGILVINASAAFLLNIASVLLITHTSAMFLVLGGIVKDILLVILSMLLFGAPVSLVQAMGYALALWGMNTYKNFKSNPDQFHASTTSALAKIRSTLRRVMGYSTTSASEEFLEDQSEEQVSLTAL